MSGTDFGTLTDPATQHAPFGFYADLHRDAPAYRDPVSGIWLITRYDDVVAAAQDTATFTSEFDMRSLAQPPDIEAIYRAEGWWVRDVLSQRDAPDHTRYRAMIEKVFSPARVKALEPEITAHAEHLVAALPPRGPVDAFHAFAIPMPLGLIAGQLGVADGDLAAFKLWSDTFVETLGLMYDHDRARACARIICQAQHYFVARMAEREASPRDDILSALVALTNPDGSRLTTEERLGFVQQILVAGNETTTNSLANGLLLLCQTPALQDQLRADPALIPGFVEELLRFDSPVQGIFRMTAHATEIGGIGIPAQAPVLLMWGAANRDQARFADAAAFDPARGNARSHLAFGFGVHRCIGSQLARAELRASFALLLARCHNMRLADGHQPVAHKPNMILRGLAELRIDYDPA